MVTQQRRDQAAIATRELVEVIERLRAEGFEDRVIITSCGCAAAHAIGIAWGAEKVRPWFAEQAEVLGKEGY